MAVTFANGASVELTSLGASWREWDVGSADKKNGELFLMAEDPGVLENSNTLCGNKPANFIVFYENRLFDSSLLLGMNVFSSGGPPFDINDPGLCGSFNFSTD